MTVAHFDFETRSTVDLRKAGAYRYAEHETTWVWCMAWCIGDGPVAVWLPGDPDPQPLLDHIRAGLPVVGHNLPFDRTIWNVTVRPRLPHWPALKVEQCICTMARAQALALPAALDQVGYALGSKVLKDQEGKSLMMRMCRPRSIGARVVCDYCEGGGMDPGDPAYHGACSKCNGIGYIDDPKAPVWWDEPGKMARLAQYCATDVEAERRIDEALPQLSASETLVYHLDQRINERGIMIDLPLVKRAAAAVVEAKKRADDQMWLLTDGEVKKCTETAKLVAWLNSRGIPCESVAKGEVEEIILGADVQGDSDARKAIELRRAAAKTSAEKYKAMEQTACADSRIRGTLAYHGAGTGRWAGRLIQPQNLPRVDPDRNLPDVNLALKMLAREQPAAELVDGMELVFGSPMDVLSKCLRAMIIAAPGKKFVGGDFSNIEGRINAWLAGEGWKIDAFQAYDDGTGTDLYVLAYARAFGLRVEDVEKWMRQIGKVMELALGYQGGVGAFQTMAAGYGIRVTDERADELKKAWRTAHPKIVASWWELQDAAIDAVYEPGKIVKALSGRVAYRAANGFLFCRLPSGRVIAYASPRLVQEERFGQIRNQVEYEGVDSYTKKWGPQRLYGGLQCENIVQAVARDIMVHAMLQAELHDLPLVLTVHDELLCEVDSTGATSEQLQTIMTQMPAWAEGLPVAAATWEDVRYVK